MRRGWFQSRYRAASHFRSPWSGGARRTCKGFNLVIERLLISGAWFLHASAKQLKFQSRYRAASHFRENRGGTPSRGRVQFQSRYRAASHFREGPSRRCLTIWSVSISLSSGFSFQGSQFTLHLKRFQVSISLSSGFSFQEHAKRLSMPSYQFQSRYRAASHFRQMGTTRTRRQMGKFQSRYRAASHFRLTGLSTMKSSSRFNLVIERLLISGKLRLRIWTHSGGFQSRYRAASHFRNVRRMISAAFLNVSISLSSGFSFQGRKRYPYPVVRLGSFNLVIERLLISGPESQTQPIAHPSRFNLVIERLLISGRRDRPRAA